jgi:transcriptional regulator with XRE-family HTH domain
LSSSVSPTISRRRLGHQLRNLRDKRGITAEEVAKHLEVSRATVSRWETGSTSIRRIELAELLDLYRSDERDKLFELAARGRSDGWWTEYDADALASHGYGDYIDLETEARVVRHYHPTLVPGPIQTEAYFRAVIQSDVSGGGQMSEPQLLERWELRAERGRRLRSNGGKLIALFDQRALTAGFDDAVLREQRSHIAQLVAEGPVEAFELPEGIRHHASGSAFTCFDYGDGDGLVVIDAPFDLVTVERPELYRSFEQLFDQLTLVARSITGSE